MSVPDSRVNHHEYGNGLRVVVSEKHVQPLVAVNLRFAVGSRHDAGRPGLAHLFEHLMFSGTTRMPRGTHLRLVQALGGDANATTSTDWTVYHHVVPAEALPVVLWLEADRLAGLADALDQTGLDAQRAVVREERLAVVDNQPYGDAVERISEALYPAGHPYRHVPISATADLMDASLDEARSFFTTCYAPDRAVLSVVGDVRAADVFAQVDAAFGWIPRPAPGSAGSTPWPVPRPGRGVVVAAPTVAPHGTLRLEARTRLAPRLVVGVPVPPVGGRDYELHRLIAILLGGGPNGRLRRRLCRDREILADVLVRPMAQMSGASLCVIELIPREGRSLDDVEKAYAEQMAEIADMGVTDEEFECAVGRYTAHRLARTDMIAGEADELSLAALAGCVPMSVEDVRTTTTRTIRDALRHWCGVDGQVLLRYTTVDE
jgi:zinc protease